MEVVERKEGKTQGLHLEEKRCSEIAKIGCLLRKYGIKTVDQPATKNGQH